MNLRIRCLDWDIDNMQLEAGAAFFGWHNLNLRVGFS